jgi:hypothetical protein
MKIIIILLLLTGTAHGYEWVEEMRILKPEEQKKVEILIVGDSTLSKIKPEIIEERTGKKVGMFAKVGFLLNEPMVKVIERLVEYYDVEVVVLSFTLWTQQVNRKQQHYAEWFDEVSRMDDKEFKDYIENGSLGHIERKGWLSHKLNYKRLFAEDAPNAVKSVKAKGLIPNPSLHIESVSKRISGLPVAKYYVINPVNQFNYALYPQLKWIHANYYSDWTLIDLNGEGYDMTDEPLNQHLIDGKKQSEAIADFLYNDNLRDE